MPTRKHSRRYSHTCLRCGKTWKGYRKKPNKCRHCGSIYWNKPRKVNEQQTKSRLEALKF